LNRLYLLTGSNIGDSLTYLHQASIHIQEQVGSLVAISSIYKTAPWGNTNQHHFLNQVIELKTKLTPEVVLTSILRIEQEMGRKRIAKWEPRVIDIDILFFNDLIMENNELTIPHSLLHLRRFTLLPLSEIAPNLVHPALGLTVASLLQKCQDISLVEKM